MCVCVCVCVCSPTLCIIIIFKCIYLAKRSLGHHWPDLLSSLPHAGSSFEPANSSCHRRDRVPWLGLKGVPTVCQLPCTGSRSLSQWTIGEVPVLFPVWSLTYLTWDKLLIKPTCLPDFRSPPTGFPLSCFPLAAPLHTGRAPPPPSGLGAPWARVSPRGFAFRFREWEAPAPGLKTAAAAISRSSGGRSRGPGFSRETAAASGHFLVNLLPQFEEHSWAQSFARYQHLRGAWNSADSQNHCRPTRPEALEVSVYLSPLGDSISQSLEPCSLF